MLKLVAKYHEDWLRIANSFLKNSEDSKDIVQDLYITLDKYNIQESKIKYKNQVNKGFIFIVLKNLCISFLKKKKNTIDISTIQLQVDDYQDRFEILDKIEEEINTWGSYESSLFKIYMYSGLSMREISNGSKKKKPRYITKTFIPSQESFKNGTGISTRSIFHTIKLCKNQIRLKLMQNHYKELLESPLKFTKLEENSTN